MDFTRKLILPFLNRKFLHWLSSKGQMKSECIYEIINFPKYHSKYLIDFCPESLFRLAPCLSPLDFWNIECHSIFFQFQTGKKINFETNSIFLSSSNLIFTACVACKNRVRTRKKNRVSKSIFFFEFVINSQIDISKIKYR